MADNTIALQVQAPTSNGAQAFQQGAAARSDIDSAQLSQAQAAIGLIGAGSLGAMGGDINGKADPAKWAQFQTLMKAHGLDLSNLGADSAPLLARASVSTLGQLQTAQNQRDFEQRLVEFTHTLQQDQTTNNFTAAEQNYKEHSEPTAVGFNGMATPDAIRAGSGVSSPPMLGANGLPIPPTPVPATAPAPASPPATSPSLPAIDPTTGAPTVVGDRATDLRNATANGSTWPVAPTDTSPAAPPFGAAGSSATNSTPGFYSPATEQAKAIGDWIISGDGPPDSIGKFSRYSAPVMAYLKSQGYDLAKAQLQITAEKAHIRAMNTGKQLQMRQSVATVSDSVKLVKQLADEWKGSGYPMLNAAALKYAAAGGPGITQEQQSLATRLIAQIADVTTSLGAVYSGGNATTDKALGLAGENLSADWSQKTFDDSISQIQQNIGFKIQALNGVEAAGDGGDNPYALDSGSAGQDPTRPAAGGAAAPPVTKTVNGVVYTQGPDGWYAP